MKKLLALLLVCALALTACAAEDPDNLFENSSTAPPPESASEASPSEVTEATPEPQQAGNPGGSGIEANYCCGNMQKNIPSGDFMPYGDKVAFLASGSVSGEDTTLYLYDPQTGEVSPFCKDAACTHTGPHCATGGCFCNLESYNGVLYGMTGTGKILREENGKFEPLMEGAAAHFWHSGGNLYVVTMDKSLLVYEGDGGTPKVLMEEYTGYWETVFNDKLYYQFTGVHQVDLATGEDQELVEDANRITDGEHIYYSPEKGHHLYRCDMDGENPELLLDEGVLTASWNFDEEFFYFVKYDGKTLFGPDSKKIYRMPKDKEKGSLEMICELPVFAYQIYTVPGFDQLFVTARENEFAASEVYLVPKEGGEAAKLELPSQAE